MSKQLQVQAIQPRSPIVLRTCTRKRKAPETVIDDDSVVDDDGPLMDEDGTVLLEPGTMVVVWLGHKGMV